ncbi:MAG: OsmC family protein [Acidobacteriota bacterium]
MIVRKSSAVWEGSLKDGRGRMKVGSGAYEGPYSFASRFEQGPGTNPEELIGAAHAGCFSMALAAALAQAGKIPKRIQTEAEVSLDRVGEGFRITSVILNTEVDVTGIEEKDFQELAEKAKANCPVSQALAGTKIFLRAKLTG